MKNLFENLEKLEYINMDYLDISASDLHTDLWDSDLDPVSHYKNFLLILLF